METLNNQHASNPAYINVLNANRGGFDFSNTGRNARIQRRLTGSENFPQAKKTGTTICGIVLKNGKEINREMFFFVAFLTGTARKIAFYIHFTGDFRSKAFIKK